MGDEVQENSSCVRDRSGLIVVVLEVPDIS